MHVFSIILQNLTHRIGRKATESAMCGLKLTNGVAGSRHPVVPWSGVRDRGEVALVRGSPIPNPGSRFPDPGVYGNRLRC